VIHSNTPMRRSRPNDCMPGCEYPYWADDTHPMYCLQHVGRGIIGHTLASGEDCGGKLEFDVSAASAKRWKEVTASDACDCWEAHRAKFRHNNVVQLETLLHDGTFLNVDFAPGEARSLAAVLNRAADIADGLVDDR